MGTAVLGIIFILIFLVAYRIGISLSSQEKMKKRRVMSLAEADEGFADVQNNYAQERTYFGALLESLASPFRNIEKQREEIALKLYRAGKTSANSVSYYFFFSTYGWLMGLVVALVLFKLGAGNKGTIMYAYYFLAVLLGLGLTFGAKLMVDSAREKRQQVLTRSFPDALDLLLICVESGLALDAALARVCKELKSVHPVITEELNRTRLELTLLNDRGKALANLGERTDMMAFKSLVAALLQSEKFGTSLVGTLRVLSDDYRQTRMMLAEEKAAKLDPKITAVTIPFMLIALLILIMTPAAMEFSSKWKTGAQAQQKK